MTKTEEIMALHDAAATEFVHGHYHPMLEKRAALKAAVERLVLAARGPSGIDPTSLGILLSHGDKRLCRVISSFELRMFEGHRRFAADTAADLVNVFLSGCEPVIDAAMKETP